MGIFNKKTWTLKKAGNRKTFVNLNTSEKIVVSDVTPTTGDEITSDQMNDLENRINDAIDSLDSSKQDSATAITTSNIGSQHVAYADSAGSASTAWSDITGKPDFATVATSGAYGDLSGRPSLATVATSGSYTDLSNKPTIPTNTNQLTNGAGFITSSGSCASATKATNDGNGNNIANSISALNTALANRLDNGSIMLKTFTYYSLHLNSGINQISMANWQVPSDCYLLSMRMDSATHLGATIGEIEYPVRFQINSPQTYNIYAVFSCFFIKKNKITSLGNQYF